MTFQPKLGDFHARRLGRLYNVPGSLFAQFQRLVFSTGQRERMPVTVR